MTRWAPDEHLCQPPVFVGNDFVELSTLGEDRERYVILQNGKEVFRGETGSWGVELPVKGLWAWNGTCALEVMGDVIVGGKSLRKETGYSEIFNWQLIDGKPFYFFAKGGKVGISYDGQPAGAAYDEVVHYKCCEPAAFNPAGNDSMVWFYARRGELWHFVEAGVFK
ncbi:MAG TPA: hypothetical protein VD969_11520 [Symbiobacteriaceae bacterium]|nr:hypothetical protein [Symbiobacteriaceae bacterium]